MGHIQYSEKYFDDTYENRKYSIGIPHILEHSVLCGSRKYPLNVVQTTILSKTLVATKFPANALVHRPTLLRYIITSKIKTPAQLEAAFTFLSITALENLKLNEFEEACGVECPPAILVCFLREHRLEWANFSIDTYSAASLKASSYAYPGMRPTQFTGSQIIMPLGHTIEHEEILEAIRLEGRSLGQEDAFISRDIHLLYVVELIGMPWEPALNLFLLQLMKCFQMTLRCYLLVFASFLWIQNQLT